LLNIGNPLQALDYLTRFLSLADGLKLPSFQANGLINLAEYYRHEGDFENSLINAKKALKIFNTLNDSGGISKMYNNIAIVYDELGEKDSALHFLNEGLSLAKKLNDLYLVPKYHVNLAHIYAEVGDYGKAEQNFQIADSIATELGLSIAFYYTNVGRAEMMELQGKTKEKIFYLEKAKKFYSSPMELEGLNIRLSKAYAEVGNYKEAYKNLDEGTTLRDSIFKNQSDLEINELIIRYQTEKQRAENEELKALNISLESATRLKNFSIIFLILFLFLAAGFFAFANHKKKLMETLNNSLSFANADVIEKNKVLTALNTINKKLITVLSHDMRTPLVNIRGVLDLIRGDLLSEEEKQFVFQQLHADMNQTENLLQNIVNWVKSASEKGLVTHMENVRVHQVVDNLISLYASNAKAKKITLQNKLDKNLNLWADEQLIHLILRNLISNALKFSYEDSEVILINNEEEKTTSIGVQDFGKGIPPEEITKILEGNSMLEKGTKNELGTGIGLTITKDAVRALGGRFWIESEINRGSTFWFSIPKKD
jgi:signal transduction histidine kinase